MKGLFLVVNKKFFNTAEQAILCPIVQDDFQDALHIPINIQGEVQGFVLCEQMRFLDLRYRDYKKTGRIKYSDVINITDAIQSIFDY